MRGTDSKEEAIFSYVSPDTRIPTRHPLRPIKAIVSDALAQMDRKPERLYSSTGRPSIAPERLIRALLLQVLYTIRCERLLVEQLEYNLLFRWFVGLSVDEPVWDHSFHRVFQRPVKGYKIRAGRFFERLSKPPGSKERADLFAHWKIDLTGVFS